MVSSSSSSPFSTATAPSKAAPARDHSRRTVAPATQDARLAQLAARTRRHIQWPRILRGADPTAAQWKWLENERNFSVYTKQDTTVSKHHFAVLAIGVVKGSVPELASLLVTNSQAEYVRKMEALYDKSFKHGMYVNDVVVPPTDHTDENENDSDSTMAPAQLSVRTATFDKLGGWLASHDEWCFLEATSYDRERQVLEKLITTLAPQDAFAADRGSLSSSSLAGGSGSAKLFSDVTAAFRVEPDQYETSEVPPGVEDTRDSSRTEAEAKPRVATRVHFYADYCPGASSVRESISARFGRFVAPRSASATPEKAVKQRLVLLAKSCDRLSHLVRRRRLGMQLVVDQKRFLHAGGASCFCCDKRLGVLVAKVCRICGQGVCGDCSAKYERECHTRRGRSDRVRLEDVRVCDPCLARVDSADYSGISDAALAGPGVVPNPQGAKPAAADLKELLHDALLQAPSPSRKDAVLSVIRCVLDQERASEPTPPTTPSPLSVEPSRTLEDNHKPRGILLTPISNDKDYVDALDYLDLETVAHTEATLANEEGRPYPIDSRKGSPEEQMAYPMPANEAQRLEAIAHTQALGHGTYAELDIICDIAAKEMGSFASLVSIITADEQRVIGANMDWLRELVIKREDAFCAHAIMGSAPLEVPHPEADIRFSKIVPVTALGARYYCGFPIVADDAHGSVIGSLCIIDNKANELTESQYAVLRKLAVTASKVVRIEGAKRRSSSLSSTPSSPTHRETREL